MKVRSPQGPARNVSASTGKNWQRDLSIGLLRLDRCNAVADVLAPEPHSVAASQPGVQQDVEPDALARADRPALLVRGDLFLGPHRDARALRSSWIGNAGSRIGLDELCICSPSKEPAHRFEEMPRLSWCGVSTIATGDDRGARDLREWLVASGFDDMREYGFALLPRRKR